MKPNKKIKKLEEPGILDRVKVEKDFPTLAKMYDKVNEIIDYLNGEQECKHPISMLIPSGAGATCHKCGKQFG